MYKCGEFLHSCIRIERSTSFYSSFLVESELAKLRVFEGKSDEAILILLKSGQ